MVVFFWIVVYIEYYYDKQIEQENLKKYNGTLGENEGDNRTYNDISSLLNVINERNKKYPFVKIKLTGIDSKEKLLLDKKYCVKIKKLKVALYLKLI